MHVCGARCATSQSELSPVCTHIPNRGCDPGVAVVTLLLLHSAGPVTPPGGTREKWLHTSAEAADSGSSPGPAGESTGDDWAQFVCWSASTCWWWQLMSAD